ncbi:conserved hypothetical protein [Treponema primitia ZAS-2]|uniref:Methyltransferase domain-containing protein n=1 Tax=Treponema primitia (strain ATCC BAA-887 / DSM 12427 / ZAS-2) TaxID=545694 RepID=F5YKU1_TREPZ|nr:class I SAM-dependent methyltransferase [Treponema primitia]AEF84053.1 conserved hypothetical protein [Treponema primitia ZAS-2]
MSDEETAAAILEAAVNAGSREERIKRNPLWSRYFRKILLRRDSLEYRDSPLALDALSLLTERGILKAETTILDIGAGTGRFALPFARKVKSLTALDICGEALDILKENAAAEGLGNTETRNGVWEEYADPSKYGFVFAALCPVICNREELLKMESLSRGYCGMIAPSRGSRSKNRHALRLLLSEKPLPGLSAEVRLLYDLLYAMGRRPGVFNYPVEHSTDTMTVDEALELYTMYYEIFGFTGEKTAEIIRAYIADNQKDGYLEDETDLSPALLFWKTPDSNLGGNYDR